MRRVYPVYIVTVFILSLSTLNLYILSSSIDVHQDEIEEDLSNIQPGAPTLLVDSDEDWINGNQLSPDSQENDKVVLTRLSRPTSSLSVSSMVVEKTVQQEIHSSGQIKKEPPSPPPNNSPTFPPIYSSCDAFNHNYFNSSYNPEHLGGLAQKYKISICTQVKNEARFIEEWLLYNWLVLRVQYNKFVGPQLTHVLGFSFLRL